MGLRASGVDRTVFSGTRSLKAGTIVGIDAASIRAGGGVTHLVELLRAANPGEHGVTRVIVWGGQHTLRLVEDRPWIEKSHQPMLDKSLAFRALWQRFRLSTLAREAGCDVLFVPGGSYSGSFRPLVTFSQNLLPFEWREIRRFGLSWMTIKLLLLRTTQQRTFRSASSLIFLTRYSGAVVMRAIKSTRAAIATIPHGIDTRFSQPPRTQQPIGTYSVARPFRILYISTVDLYKHQWHVADAVAQLRASGIPVALDLVGPAYPPALKRLKRALSRLDPEARFLQYSGPIPHDKMHAVYAQADLAVFASSCETFGQILGEAMAAGLPIACSDRSSLPEVLGDAGLYFNPEDPADIARAMRTLIDDPGLRMAKAEAAFARSRLYTWPKCADDTFACLAQAVRHA